MHVSRCYAENHDRGANGKGVSIGNANTYDGRTIADSFELLEFVSWLRRSTRDATCVLLSQDAHGNPHVPLDQVRKTVGSRAVTVLLANAVQQSAHDQLGIVNPYHGAARIFPPGDAWRDDSSLVYCVLPAPPQPAHAQHALRYAGRIIACVGGFGAICADDDLHDASAAGGGARRKPANLLV